MTRQTLCVSRGRPTGPRHAGPPRTVAVVPVLAAVLAVFVTAQHTSLDAANDAWQRGEYIAALNGYINVLGAPGGDRVLESIALTTGELFHTRELDRERTRRTLQPGRQVPGLRNRPRDVAPHEDREERRRAHGIRRAPRHIGDVLDVAAAGRLPQDSRSRRDPHRLGRARESLADALRIGIS